MSEVGKFKPVENDPYKLTIVSLPNIYLTFYEIIFINRSVY